jgi:hypothetical protein
MRKLCADEVGGVKIKKNEKKNTFCNSKNMYFLYCFFVVVPLAFHLKDDL